MSIETLTSSSDHYRDKVKHGDVLSKTEQSVYDLLITDTLVHEIAEKLFKSLGAVKFYTSIIYKKKAVRGRCGLIIKHYEDILRGN